MDITGRALKAHRQELGLSQARLAEITGVSQHLLSAFERENATLSEPLIVRIRAALVDRDKVSAVVGRAKRYRTHEYAPVARTSDRASNARRSPGNAAYLEQLAALARSHADPAPRRLKAVSLFSGCGGFSLGFSAAGFEIKGHLELDPDLRAIYQLNFPTSLELGGDITGITDAALQDYAARLGPIDVIIGGPPCQGFSLSGKRDVADPRNQLFRHYLRFVRALRPRAAILENVRLLCSMKNEAGGFVKDDIHAEFRAHGYALRHFEANAKDHGVPQHRERVFFVAVRDDQGVAPSMPAPSHAQAGAKDDLFASLPAARSFADACSDLPYLESGESSDDAHHAAVKHPDHVIDWLWDVPQGASAHDNADPLKRPPSGYNTTYKRQVWDEPASTVQTTFGMISGCRNVHPVATRSLTIREAARIQSFPDDFRLAGTLGAIRTGLGNAVPPLLARRLAEHLKLDVL